MNVTTPAAAGIVLVFSRPSDFAQEADWSAWYRDDHLPATLAASGASAATWWEHIERPAAGSPPVGFTHLTIYDLDDLPRSAPLLLDTLDPSTGTTPLHPADMVVGVEVLNPAGRRWTKRATTSSSVQGLVVAYVGPNHAAREDEWNAWLDDIHIPDMINSGAFLNATRWVRTDRARFGPNYVTIYDVATPDINEAVARSGAAMAPARELGRLRPYHAGGLRAALRRAA